MADFDTRFMSKTVEWPTPQELYLPLHDEFRFEMDVAATAENTKCPAFWTKEQDGLVQPWARRNWMNPPYGRDVPRWLARALDESKRGATTVCLIPARTNTGWFHALCLEAAEVRFVRGRPKFGDADHGLPLPLAVVIYRPRYYGVINERTFFKRDRLARYTPGVFRQTQYGVRLYAGRLRYEREREVWALLHKAG